jgi:hypothetical protein
MVRSGASCHSDDRAAIGQTYRRYQSLPLRVYLAHTVTGTWAELVSSVPDASSISRETQLCPPGLSGRGNTVHHEQEGSRPKLAHRLCTPVG